MKLNYAELESRIIAELRLQYPEYANPEQFEISQVGDGFGVGHWRALKKSVKMSERYSVQLTANNWRS